MPPDPSFARTAPLAAEHGEAAGERTVDRFTHRVVGLEHEQDHEGDDQREQRHGFGEREAQQHVAEHAGRGLGVAQRARHEAAEDVADADADAGEGDGGEAGADELGCRSVHCTKSLSSIVRQMDGVVEIEAGQDREDVGLQEGDQQFRGR